MVVAVCVERNGTAGLACCIATPARVKTRCLQQWVLGRSLGAKISGGRGRPWGIFFAFYKTSHILLSNGENCTVLRAVVLTQYRRVTDRQADGRTDGIAVANTALAMRALRAL